MRLAQHALCDAGFATDLDGIFGRGMENAVRDYQRAHGLLPDGRIGSRTAALLHPPAGTRPAPGPLTDLPDRFGPAIVAPATAALSAASLPGAKRACAGQRVSDQGLRFILAEETGSRSALATTCGHDTRARSRRTCWRWVLRPPMRG